MKIESKYGTFLQRDNMLGHKTRLKKNIQTIQNIFSNHDEMKLETNKKKQENSQICGNLTMNSS